jgi:ribose-phosphate pyrophosphokinase
MITETRKASKKRAVSTSVCAFADSFPFARRLAAELGARLRLLKQHRFPDGEALVRAEPHPERNALVVRTLDHPDPKLFETMLAADALRRGGARRVTLVAPYLPYMRQDTVFEPGEPVSQRVLGAMLALVFDRVVTVEAHLHRVRTLREAIPCRAISLSAAPVLARWMKSRAPDALVVGPDHESTPWVRKIGRASGLKWIVGRKERRGDRSVRVHFDDVPSAGRAFVIDDIASSGATLAAAARALRQRGVKEVDAIVVHALFAPGSMALIRRAGVRRVISCDTIANPTNAIGCAPLVARALEGIA